MKTSIFLLSPLISVLIFSSCQTSHPKADLVILNGKIYTVNPNQPSAEAIAIKSDTIAYFGTTENVKRWISDSTTVLNLKGKTLTPGFIDGHAHLLGLGKKLLNLDVSKTKSYDEIISLVKEKVNASKPGEWIIGGGWHQDKWDDKPERLMGGFPTHHELSKISPNNPVYLRHASGHAALANEKAMDMAGLNKETIDPDGGEILRDISGQATGVLNETAQSLVYRIVPQDTEEKNIKAIELAIERCLENGITSFHDAGVDSSIIAIYKSFAIEKKLKVRLYVMLNGGNPNLIKAYAANGPEIGIYQNFLTIRSIKLYADGALGSRGALLLDDYNDAPKQKGLRIQKLDYIEEISRIGHGSGFQICTHCIGDHANRELLDLYEGIYQSDPKNRNNLRFRIEHAQHISNDDIPRFGELGVIPSMQAIHLSSDRPWAINRLGKDRIIEGAYVWNKLAESGATIVNGTDAPVEPLNPIACFYASVSRQTLEGTPNGGYEPDQKMSREDALKSYTINNAYGAFEENIKGSIEVGKLADFTVFSQDIMEVPISELLDTKVAYTIVGGKILYERE